MERDFGLLVTTLCFSSLHLELAKPWQDNQPDIGQAGIALNLQSQPSRLSRDSNLLHVTEVAPLKHAACVLLTCIAAFCGVA